MKEKNSSSPDAYLLLNRTHFGLLMNWERRGGGGGGGEKEKV